MPNLSRDFALATLPETSPLTSCLDIVNFFQEGKSHMVLVSEYPGEDHGAIGVVTLEDVIEELIGEEIMDESDVFVGRPQSHQTSNARANQAHPEDIFSPGRACRYEWCSTRPSRYRRK